VVRQFKQDFLAYTHKSLSCCFAFFSLYKCRYLLNNIAFFNINLTLLNAKGIMLILTLFCSVYININGLFKLLRSKVCMQYAIDGINI